MCLALALHAKRTRMWFLAISGDIAGQASKPLKINKKPNAILIGDKKGDNESLNKKAVETKICTKNVFLTENQAYVLYVCMLTCMFA